MKKVVKTFEEFVNEAFFFVPDNTGGISTNYKGDQSSLKQGYPDAENADDNDAFNPSVINKNAEEEPGGDVAFVSRKNKTKGGSIDTLSNRTKEQGTNGNSIYGQSGVAESTELEVGIEVEMEHTDDRKEAEKIAKDHISEDPKYYSKLYKAGLIDEPKAIELAKKLDEKNFEEPKQGRWYIHKKSGQTWQLNWLDTEDNEAVMIKSGGRPLTKRIKLKNFDKNWKPKILGEGGLGDNEVAGQRVYTQTVDKSKQGYQDAMYYGDDEIDNHGPECDCTDCLEKYV